MRLTRIRKIQKARQADRTVDCATGMHDLGDTDAASPETPPEAELTTLDQEIGAAESVSPSPERDVGDIPDAAGLEPVDEALRSDFQKELRRLPQRWEKGAFEKRSRPCCKGVRLNESLLREVDRLIAEEWGKRKRKRSFWSLNCLVYAGAMVIKNYKDKPHQPSQMAQCTLRKQKLAAKILQLRRLIGWLTCVVTRRRAGVKPTARQ